MSFNFEDVDKLYDRPKPEEVEDSNFLEETGQGVMYGLAEFGKSVGAQWAYNKTVGALDNSFRWEDDFVDAPDTLYGNIVGSFTQFLVPYGILTKGIAALNGAKVMAKMPKMKKFVGFLNGSETLGFNKGLEVAHKAGKTSGIIGNFMHSMAGNAGRELIKGGFVDAIAFQGDASRLSDLVQSHPDLDNVVTRFLAGDEDDSEAFGRFKNVLEGAMLGVPLDLAFDWVRGVKAKRDVLKRGGTEEAGNAAARKVKDDSFRKRGEAAQQADNEALDAAAGQTHKIVDPEGATKTITNKTIDKEAAISVAAARKAIKKELDRYAKATPTERKFVDEQHTTSLRGHESFEDVYAGPNGGLDEVHAKAASDAMEDDFRLPSTDAEKGVNYRTASEDVKIDNKVPDAVGNYSMHVGIENSARRVLRFMEEMEFTPRKASQTEAEWFVKASENLRKWGKSGEKEQIKMLNYLRSAPAELQEMMEKTQMITMYQSAIAPTVIKKLKALQDPDITFEAAQEARHAFTNFVEFQKALDNIGSGVGRFLRSFKTEINAAEIQKALGTDYKFTIVDVLKDMDASGFDPKLVNQLAKQLNYFLDGGDMARIMKQTSEFMQAPLRKKTFAVAQEYHIASLLSGLHTQMVNAMSGAIMSVYVPLEKLIGGGLMTVSGTVTGNTEFAHQGIRVMHQEIRRSMDLIGDLYDSLMAVVHGEGKAFLSDSMVEGGHFSPTGALRNAAKDNRALAQAAGKAHAGHALASATTTTANLAFGLPMKGLYKMDEFFKIWNGRAETRRVLTRRMMDEGVDPSMIAERVNSQLITIMKAQGNVSQASEALKTARRLGGSMPQTLANTPGFKGLAQLDDDALSGVVQAGKMSRQYGQQITHTNDLRTGVFGAAASSAQHAVRKIPLLRFVAPFIRTPTNLADYTFDRTIGAVFGMAQTGLHKAARAAGLNTADGVLGRDFSRLSKELASIDPAVRAQAHGKITTGMAFMSLIYMEVSKDSGDELPVLTGSGPEDPDVLRTYKARGFQPFSIKIGGKYYSYHRLDPIGTYIGLAVDMAENIKEGFDDDIELQTNLMYGLWASFSANLSSKSYIQNMTKFTEALVGGDTSSVGLFASQTLSGFVPTILGNVTRINDPVMRVYKDLTDRSRAKIPGKSSSMPPRRDLLGKPIPFDYAVHDAFMPIRITQVKDTVVENELGRFAYGFSEPSTTKAGVDLLDDNLKVGNQTAYDRYLEKYGTVKIAGKDIRQALRKLIKSKGYQKLDPDIGPSGEHSPRVAHINKIIRRYRRAAWKEMLRENPTLKSAVKQSYVNRARRRRGLSING